MTEDCFNQCIALLRAMPSQIPWSEATTQLFAIVLMPLTDTEGRAAVRQAVMTCDWRPAPAALRRLAIEEAAPIPTAEEVYAEIMEKAECYGIYGVTHSSGRYRVEGPPPFSHPLVEQVVRFLGGWRMICTGEAQMQEGLKKQTDRAWASAARRWQEHTGEMLALLPDKRDIARLHITDLLKSLPGLPAPPTDEDSFDDEEETE